MRWRKFGTLLVFLFISINCIYALETRNHNEDDAPNSNTVIHHPTASLSIAGDLKDVKLKASIAQLVRALQNPSNATEPERRPKLELEAKKPVPQLITKHTLNVHGTNGRKLFSGGQVPEEITISSQPIKIGGANKTGGKRSRSIATTDSDGVKTIEGVRVPDDEHDKHHTWRNARVIKGFLVPNGRSANPHKKRQIMITDPQAYLAAAQAAAAQGATTIIDGSSILNGQQSSQMAYSYAHPTQQQQPQVAKAHPQVVDSGLSSQPIYNAQQPQQPVHHQYQSTAGTNGQTTAFAYAPQQQGQMYVLPDGNTYLQYSPVQQTGQQNQNPQLTSQLSHSQTQFSSRSGELPSSSSSSSSSAQLSQVQGVASQSDTRKTQESQLQQQISQAQAVAQAIQDHQNAQAQQSAQTQQLQQQEQAFQQAQRELQQAQASQSLGVVSPQQAQYPQDVLAAAASSAQYILQSQPNQQQASSAVYQQLPGQNTFSERIQNYQVAQNAAQNGFYIQPQTYVAGPGGQAFTIPIPVPADQVQQQQQGGAVRQREDWHSHQNQKQRAHYHQQHNSHGKDKNFANRVMDALHINKKALERVDTTTAVVPALASTGIFLGLSALAAGWYLSKGNREVGIVRRTGKPAAGTGGGSSSQSVLSRSRRDLAVPTTNYNPQEVDQATFFQSIIQQSLEKTQQQYEDQVEPVNSYNREVQQQQQEQPVYNREPERELERPRPKQRNNERRPTRPQNRDDDYYPNSKVSNSNYAAQDKSGALTVGSSKNFAKVFIPALILGLSVISITALIFGWYVTGANREIAFLEPASYSRKKRSLTALSDGWLQRTITAIHGNPYDRMPAPTSKSFLPNPFMDRETSKTSDLEFKISNTGLTGVLAGGAIIAIVALGLANSLSESNNRQLKTGRANPSSFIINNNNQQNTIKHLRAPRGTDVTTNSLTDGHPDNPGFLSAILSNIELTQDNIINKLQDVGKWQESPCAQQIFCDLMIAQDDDTVQLMEKRMATFINMLPESMSKTLSHTFSDVVSAIHKRDCSRFSCRGHHVNSSITHKPLSPVNFPR